jgi:Holliday junction resolvase RusA-like endonuclease
MNELTIILPLPPKVLHPNAVAHWGRKIKPKKQARIDAGYAAAVSIGPWRTMPWSHVSAHCRWFVRHHNGLRMDCDNATAWLKAYFDGIADQGVVDNDKAIEKITHEFAVDKLKPRVEITIRRET